MFTSVFASLDAKRPIRRSATPDSQEVCLREMSYTASLSGRFGTSFLLAQQLRDLFLSVVAGIDAKSQCGRETKTQVICGMH